METAVATLHTSLGTVAPGEDLPAKLPRKEHLFLRQSGGTVGDFDAADKKAITAARKAVGDAEKLVADAKTETDKVSAIALLGEAKALLADLTGD